MAEVTITNSSVVAGDSAKIDRSGTAAEVLAAGQWVYKSGTTWLKADCDASTTDSTKSVVAGLTLNDGLIIGSPVAVATEGDVTVGSVVAQGVVYVLAGTAGKMQLVSDLATDDWVTVCCIGKSASVITIKPWPTLTKLA